MLHKETSQKNKFLPIAIVFVFAAKTVFLPETKIALAEKRPEATLELENPPFEPVATFFGEATIARVLALKNLATSGSEKVSNGVYAVGNEVINRAGQVATVGEAVAETAHKFYCTVSGWLGVGCENEKESAPVINIEINSAPIINRKEDETVNIPVDVRKEYNSGDNSSSNNSNIINQTVIVNGVTEAELERRLAIFRNSLDLSSGVTIINKSVEGSRISTDRIYEDMGETADAAAEDAVTGGDLSFNGINGTFSGDVTVSGTTTINGPLVANGSAGVSGYVLQSTGTGAQWVATSTLGISGGGGSGLLSLNGLTDDPQTFATSTSGTDFNIVSSGSVHTFNLPTASSLNRGLLSTADWTTFNNKGSGTVTAVSVASANGFTGSSSGGPTPALTLGTSITGILKGNGTAISAAVAGTDYEVPLTFSTGLSRSTNTITVNTSQNIATLSNLTSNGFVKTSGGDGTLSIDTNTYLTATTVNSLNPIQVGNLNNTNSLCNTVAMGLSNTITAGGGTSLFGVSNSASGLGQASAIGRLNTVSGYRANSFGFLNTASQDCASAFGHANTASGVCAASFGSSNTASGQQSSAVGVGNTVTGTQSSAFGYLNTASNGPSVALGFTNNATALCATAVGLNNSVTGCGSIAAGFANTACGRCSAALGLNNCACGSNSAGLGSIAIGRLNVATNSGTSALGYGNTASGAYSSAFGYVNIASGGCASAFGYCNTSSNTLASAYGSCITNSTANSVEIGPVNTEKLQISASGVNFVTGGAGTFCVNGVAVGGSFDANALNPIEVGMSNLACSSTASAIGHSNTSCCDYSSAIGYFNATCGVSASAFGYMNCAMASGASAFGYTNDVTAIDASAFGTDNNAYAQNATVIGSLNTVNSYGLHSIAAGHNNTVSCGCSSAFGYVNCVSGCAATATGYCNTVSHCYASAVGAYNNAACCQNAVFGYDNDATDHYSAAFGLCNTASGYCSFAIGGSNSASGVHSVSVGIANTNGGSTSSVFGESNSISSYGYMSTAVGVSNNITVCCASAFGLGNAASGVYAIGAGSCNTVSGAYAASFGYCNCSANSHAVSLGVLNTASYACAVAIGSNNDALCEYTSAFGYQNSVSALYSSAFGYGNLISSNMSNAIGWTNTIETSSDSQAIGGYNRVTGGAGASALGYTNCAVGIGSQSIGGYNCAAGTIFVSSFGTNINNTVDYSLKIGPADANALHICCSGVTTTAFKFNGIADGTLSLSSGVLTSSSDERLKDIKGDFTQGLDAIIGINPIDYTWKSFTPYDHETVYSGFSAQNVFQNIPTAISVGPDGMYGLNDRPILAASVNAIKELNTITLNTKFTTVGNAEAIAALETLVGPEGISEAALARFATLDLTLEDIYVLTNKNTEDIASLSDRIDAITEHLESFGATVYKSLVTFVDVIAQKITVSELIINNEENPEQTGLIIYDRKTGEPICVYFEDGVMKSEPGECDDTNGDTVEYGDTTSEQEQDSSGDEAPADESNNNDEVDVTESTDESEGVNDVPVVDESDSAPSSDGGDVDSEISEPVGEAEPESDTGPNESSSETESDSASNESSSDSDQTSSGDSTSDTSNDTSSDSSSSESAPSSE